MENKKKPWWDCMIIGHRNTVYLIFEIFMCALCIISSYFYASLIGFRYTFKIGERERVMITMLVFESLFLI